MRAFIHGQAEAKNHQNRPEEIDGQIARIHHNGVSCKTILKYAWDTDKKAVVDLKQRFGSIWNTLFDEEPTDYIDEIIHMNAEGPSGLWTVQQYSEQYVRPYPIQDWDTILLQSQMGTGKTVQLFDVIKSYQRVILLSARRSYSMFIQSELLTLDLGFKNYMDLRGHLSGYNKLILQVESLHRIAWEYQLYDLVIMDESESLLFQMNSVGTHGSHHKENYEILERVVREAGKVIAMDAFVNMRSFQFLDSLRGSDMALRKMCLFIHNTYQPYDRKAMELCVVSGNCVLPDFAGLVQQCQEFAAAGKRIVFVCTSKTKGQGLFELLKGQGYTVLFHSSEDSKEEKDILLNVRTEWAKYQIVIYTTTITVGVSYSDVPVESEFDELFLYATASCALPRDIAQALLRARVIKSNRLWFCVEERCVRPIHVGLKAIEENVNRRKELFDGTGTTWECTPEWVRRLIVQNENEIAVSRKYFSLVLKRYLRMSGYVLEMPRAAEELLELEMEREVKPYFDEIREVDEEEADILNGRVMSGDASKEGKVILLKHRMLRRFEAGDEALDAAREAWNTFFLPEEGKTQTWEALFWNIVREKQRDVKRALTAEAECRYVEQAKIGVLKQRCIQDLCLVLGMEHSCVEKTWTQEAFAALAPDILKDEEKLRKTMGLRPYRGKKKESEFLKAAHPVDQVLASWSGTSFESSCKQIQKDNKRLRIYSFKSLPITSRIIGLMK